ncbi:MAG: hypothetical protein LBE12_09790 [Planctomycetaceae bacterium]|nr:hypothetical protein [Planctomycetaceae bacterium]
MPSHFDISTIKKQIDTVGFPKGIIDNPFDRMLETCHAVFSSDGLNLTAIAALSTIPDDYLNFALPVFLDKKNVIMSSFFVEVYFTYSVYSESSKTKNKSEKEDNNSVAFLSYVVIKKETVGTVDDRPSRMTSCIVSFALSEEGHLLSYGESYTGGGEVPTFKFVLNNNKTLKQLMIDYNQVTRKLIWNDDGKLIRDDSIPYPNPKPSLSKEKLDELITLEKNFFSVSSKKKKTPLIYFDFKKIKQIKNTDSSENKEIQSLFSSINNRNDFLIKNYLGKLIEHHLFDFSGRIGLKLTFSSEGSLSLECLQEQNDGISKGYKMEFSKDGSLLLYQEGSFKHFAMKNFKQTLTEVSFYPSGYPEQYRILYGDQIKGQTIQWDQNGKMIEK